MQTNKNMLFLVLFIVTGFASLGLCIQSSDFWSNVTETNEYKALSECAQQCLLNVNTVTDCISYGCVCSENTLGSNFRTSYTNISSCAQQNCQDQAAKTEVIIAFRNLCEEAVGLSPTLTASPSSIPTSTASSITVGGSSSSVGSTSTPQTTGPSYLLLIKTPPTLYTPLSPCSKFCLNSCRDVNGTVNEANCYTTKQPAGWDSYKGLAATLACDGPSCLCANGFFDITFGVLLNISVQYCNYLPMTSDKDSPEYDLLIAELANYCAENGFPPDEYFAEIEGVKDTMGVLTSSNSSGLNNSDKIAIGVGIASLVGTAIGSFFTWRMWSSARTTRARLGPSALAARIDLKKKNK